MTNINWSKPDIKLVAQSSGKPLEVACAQALLGAGWTPRLGSYFADGALDTLRELDVLAEKKEVFPALSELTVRVRALVSCRGFPADRSPLTYSVSTACVPIPAPRLLTSHRARRARVPGGQPYGSIPDLEERAAARFLDVSGLSSARPLVAFDMIERIEKVAKGDAAAPIEYKRSAEGDKRLFLALDSSVKAALSWYEHDLNRESGAHAHLNVPVCVLSIPFWDVCIDGGVIGDPAICQRGFQVNSYPTTRASPNILVTVWDVAEINTLVKALDDLFIWFRDEICGPSFSKMWSADG